MSMLPKKNYYTNNYFDFLNSQYFKDYQHMKTDIYEQDDLYKIEIDLPGLKKENINIMYDNGYLSIHAVKSEVNEHQENYIRKERFFGEIKRNFFIGEKRHQDIKASFVDGTLIISFPKEDQPKKDVKHIVIE